MKNYTFYDKTTGLFHPNLFSTTREETVLSNTPPNHVALEGHHDHLKKKFDLEAETVIDYQPPAPSIDHEWNTEAKCWKLSAIVSAQRQAHDAARSEIAALEASGIRPMRELALGFPGAQERLSAIDMRISELRAIL